MAWIYYSLLGLVLVFTPVFASGLELNPDSLKIIKQAQKDINYLCSKRLAGRGYHKNGHIKAAKYLSKAFKQAGLKPLTALNSYLQPFFFDLNLVSTAQLFINKIPLKYGLDYICAPTSGSFSSNASNTVYIIDSIPQINFLSSDQYVLLLSPKINKRMLDSIIYVFSEAPQKAKVIGFYRVENKLTASLSSERLPIPVFLFAKTNFFEKTRLKVLSGEVSTAVNKIRSQNVIGIVPGTQYPDSAVIFCAHYDHLGQVEHAIFRGANDNASGVAFLLSLARKTAKQPRNYTTIFIAFGAEECGLIGSNHFVNNPVWPLKFIKAVYNFDLLGHGQQGITVVASKIYPFLYKSITATAERLRYNFPIHERDNAPNSDHYPFTQANVPAVFIYTLGGPKHYHDIFDTPKALSYYLFYTLHQIFINVPLD